jgi:hypothetical protein
MLFKTHRDTELTKSTLKFYRVVYGMTWCFSELTASQRNVNNNYRILNVSVVKFFYENKRHLQQKVAKFAQILE